MYLFQLGSWLLYDDRRLPNGGIPCSKAIGTNWICACHWSIIYTTLAIQLCTRLRWRWTSGLNICHWVMLEVPITVRPVNVAIDVICCCSADQCTWTSENVRGSKGSPVSELQCSVPPLSPPPYSSLVGSKGNGHDFFATLTRPASFRTVIHQLINAVLSNDKSPNTKILSRGKLSTSSYSNWGAKERNYTDDITYHFCYYYYWLWISDFV